MNAYFLSFLLFIITNNLFCTSTENIWLYSNVQSVNYLFCHGLGDNDEQLFEYQRTNLLPAQALSFNFNDWHDDKFDRKKAALGQDADISTLNTHYSNLCDQTLPIVLYGVSRGASTIINFIGKKKPRNLAALILESPFAHVDDVVKHCVPCAWLLPMNFILKYLYPSYNPAGEQPINYIDVIASDVNIPIFFICSKNDRYVPCSTTLTLYKKMLVFDRKNVHIFMLEKGTHGFLFDEAEYAPALHAFFKKYNLPYCEDLAKEGEKYIDNVKV